MALSCAVGRSTRALDPEILDERVIILNWSDDDGKLPPNIERVCISPLFYVSGKTNRKNRSVTAGREVKRREHRVDLGRLRVLFLFFIASPRSYLFEFYTGGPGFLKGHFFFSGAAQLTSRALIEFRLLKLKTGSLSNGGIEQSWAPRVERVRCGERDPPVCIVFLRAGVPLEELYHIKCWISRKGSKSNRAQTKVI